MCSTFKTCFLFSRSYMSSGGIISPNSLSSWIPSFSFCGKIIIRSLSCMSITMQRCWIFGGLLWTGCLVVTVSTGLWWDMLASEALFWFSFGQIKHFWYLQVQDVLFLILSYFAELQLVAGDIKMPVGCLENTWLYSLKILLESLTFVFCSSPGLALLSLAFSFFVDPQMKQCFFPRKDQKCVLTARV